MKRRVWTAPDVRLLRKLYADTLTDVLVARLNRPRHQIYAKAKRLGLGKSAAFFASAASGRLQKGSTVGLSGRYPKGHVPSNKGLRRPGWHRGRMKQTQFKKGERSGMAARHHMPIGATRLIEGYIALKVADVPNVHYTVNWKLLHVLNWERANGRPLPAGHCLWFRDGNRQNPDVENLELITRAELGRRSPLHKYPKPLKRAIQLRGALNRRINRMERDRGRQHS